jgi:DNA repair protein SbcD/Mre11
MKIIILGDLHISGTNPKCRLDDLTQTQFLKLEEIVDYANKYRMNIYQTGDVFDSPNIGYSIFTRLHITLNRLEHNMFYFVYGNHDLYFHNPKSKGSTPLHSLQTTTENVEHIYISELLWMDFQNWGEDITKLNSEVLLCHKAIVSPGYYRKEKTIQHWNRNDISCSSLDDELKKYEVIFCGHWHKRYIEKTKNQLIINPGALTRREASQDSFETFPSFVVFDTKTYDYDIIPLKNAEKAENVISDKHLELTKAKRSMTKSIEEFIDNLKKQEKVNKKSFLDKLNKFVETELNDYEKELFQEILSSSVGGIKDEE